MCTRLDGSTNLDVVIAPATGVDPRRVLSVTVYDRTFEPRAATDVGLEFPDGTAASATTDAQGRFTVTMGDAYPSVKLRYAASDDPGDVILFQDYFVDVGDIGTDDGVSRRLHNLGFSQDAEPADAIAAFQGTQGLNPTGEIDDETRAQLDRVYSGEAPISSPASTTAR